METILQKYPYLTSMMLDRIKNNIKTIRNSKSLSREQVAELMSLDVGKVKRLEWGKSKIDLQTLELFASVMDMTLIDVLSYPEKLVSAKSIGLQETLEATLNIKLAKNSGDKALQLVSFEIS